MAKARAAPVRDRGREPGASWRAAALVAALALLAYARTPGAGFMLDDPEIVRDNPALASLHGLPALWTKDYWSHVRYADHALYRPFTLTTYALQRAAGGTSPGPYHAGNVLLHALASVALMGVVGQVFRDRRAAFAAGALFAVHPVHVEAVAGIVGRAEILGLLGTLGAVAASRRCLAARDGRAAAGWGAAAAVSFFLGAASKESAFVAPAVVGLTEWLVPTAGRAASRRRMVLGAALVAAATAYLALRAHAVSGRSVSAVFAGAGTGARVLTALRVFGENVGLMLAPLRLSAEYGPGQVPIARSLSPRVLLGLGVLVAAVAATVGSWRRRPSISWGLATFLVILLPLSNLLFPIGVAKAERILYAPSAGFLVALAAFGAALTERRRALGAGILAVVTLAGTGATFARTAAWHDNCSLAEATLRTAPDSPLFLTMHARCLRDAGRADEARRVLTEALRVNPELPSARLLLSEVEEAAGRREEALQQSEAVLAREPQHLVALSRSSVLLDALGRPAEAAARYEQWRHADPSDPRPWAGLMKALFESGQAERALAVAREAAARFPGDELVRRNAAALEQMVGGAGAGP